MANDESKKDQKAEHPAPTTPPRPTQGEISTANLDELEKFPELNFLDDTWSLLISSGGGGTGK